MDPVNRASALAKHITRLPGLKIVTLVDAHEEPIKIDVTTDGGWGYAPEHVSLFLTRLQRALHSGGALIVRQFTDLGVLVEDRLVPVKRIRGFMLSDGTWRGLTAAELETSYGAPGPTELLVDCKLSVI